MLPWPVNVSILLGGFILGVLFTRLVWRMLELRPMTRRRAAEESERILQGETRMEVRTFVDPSNGLIYRKEVRVGSRMLPYQQITAEDFNQLDERIKALESRRPR